MNAWCAGWITTRAQRLNLRTADWVRQSALLGGGRYDGLSEMLGGPKAPGIGFALGLDRFVLALQAEETVAAPSLNPAVFIAPLGQGMNAEAAVIARELRKQGIATELGDDSFARKKIV